MKEREKKVTTEAEQAAEAAYLSRMIRTQTKRSVKISWIPEGEQDLGYTDGKNATIHIAWGLSPFTDENPRAMRFGVGVHETLHLLFTNFVYSQKKMKKLSRAEAGIAMDFANTIEDPAIEWMAGRVFGGALLESLRYSIKRIYQCSKGIEHSKSAYSQLINALIHFGDMGVVKGTWTFPEAKEAFKKVAPLYNEAITCTDSKRRIDIALECMELTRDLWKEQVKEEEFFEELMEKLAKALASAMPGLSPMDLGNEDGDTPMEGGSPAEKLSKKREETLKKMEKSDSGASESDEKDPSEDGSAGKDSEEADAGEAGVNGGSDSKAAGAGKVSKGEESEEDDIYVIDEELLSELSKEIDRMATSSAVKKRENSETKEYDISSPAFKGKYSVLNRQVKNEASAMTSSLYRETINKYRLSISRLTKALEEMFKEEEEQMLRKTSGSYNILRGTIGNTAKIFDKRRDPGTIGNTKVFFLVDQSGSMSSRDSANKQSRMQNAAESVLIAAEAMSACNIPFYVMGFTSDTCGVDVVHNHFVSWDHPEDRKNIVGMQAMSNNFDSYSIRYATEMLKEEDAENKILFIVSDGSPASSQISYTDGIMDNILAIKEARAEGITVFGMAIGTSCPVDDLHRMYGSDFIHISDTSVMANALSRSLKKTLKK